MAQSTKTRGKNSGSRNGSQARSSSNSRTKTAKRATARRTSSSGNRSKPTTNAAVDRAKAAGSAVAGVASKAKTPLIAGGTALAGAAVGAVVKDRLDSSRSKGALGRLRGGTLRKPAARLRKVDLDTVQTFGDRMSAYGRQASDIARAVEKTRKKNN